MNNVDIPADLLNDVKSKLYISWDEDDEQVKKIIIRACRYLQSKVASKLEYSQESLEYDLLLERCRYDWNNALDEFEKNYASEILAFIQGYALREWEDGESSAVETY